MYFLYFHHERKNTVLTAPRPKNLSWPPAVTGTGSSPLHPGALPCASPRSEHGILGKRRVKLRSPAVGRTPRGCQPGEQFRPRLSGTLWSAAVRVRGSRAQRRGRLTTQLTSPRAFVLARIRLTRTAAERGPVLSGACEPGRDLRRNVMFTPLVAQ